MSVITPSRRPGASHLGQNNAADPQFYEDVDHNCVGSLHFFGAMSYADLMHENLHFDGHQKQKDRICKHQFEC